MEAAIQQGIRLNIGCGRRVLDGWINVDKKTRESAPDVDSDVRDLPFPDNYADEVMAIHLVEHFYAWEAPDVINEWRRVLKPGGKLIIECPDLEKTIKHMYEGRSEPNLTMWPLYGDPTHQDPLMCHKWGYNTYSLEKLLSYCGFDKIESEPAQFHMKDIRDMRMVATK